jgi:hypothetical protein
MTSRRTVREELHLFPALDALDVYLAAGVSAPPRHRVVGAGGLLRCVDISDVGGVVAGFT